jgi:hypothetical protein
VKISEYGHKVLLKKSAGKPSGSGTLLGFIWKITSLTSFSENSTVKASFSPVETCVMSPFINSTREKLFLFGLPKTVFIEISDIFLQIFFSLNSALFLL